MIKSDPSTELSLVMSQFAFQRIGGGAVGQEPKHRAATMISEPSTVLSGTKSQMLCPGAPVKSPTIDTTIQRMLLEHVFME